MTAPSSETTPAGIGCLQASYVVPAFPPFDLEAAKASWSPYPGLGRERRQEIELHYDRINRRVGFRLERTLLRSAGHIRRSGPGAGVLIDAVKRVGAKRALQGFAGDCRGAAASVLVDGRDATRPLITIGITCYDAEDTIRRAVESALAQTWTAREIIIVDDGSADRSARVIEEIGRTHDEIRLIRHGRKPRGCRGAKHGAGGG